MAIKKSICILTSVHRHDDVRIYHKQAKSLKEAGFNVKVLCSDFSGTDENGIEFIKIKLPKNRFLRMIFASMKFYKTAKALNADYYHFHDPELIRMGKKLAKTAKVIYDVHEDVPRQLLTKPYLNPKIAKIISNVYEEFEELSVKKFFAVVAAEPVIFDRLSKYQQNTVMVCNFPKLDEFMNPSQYENRTDSVCYIGGITKIRGIFEMLDAITNINVKLVLAGDFEDNQLKTAVFSHSGYKKVDFRGFVGRKEIIDILNIVKAGLVTLEPIPKYLTALPVKMFEYMAAGVPVIASNFPYWQEIINETKCGVCVNPLSCEEITNAINYMLTNQEIANEMGKNGRKAVFEKYNWQIEKEKLIKLYEQK